MSSTPPSAPMKSGVGCFWVHACVRTSLLARGHLNHHPFKTCVVPALSALVGLRTLNLSCCSRLNDVQSLSWLVGLRILDLKQCTALGDVRPLSALVGLHTLYRCYTRACLESTATIRAYSPSHRRNSRVSGLDSAMCLRVLFASPLSPWISAYRRHGGTLTMGPPPGLGTA